MSPKAGFEKLSQSDSTSGSGTMDDTQYPITNFELKEALEYSMMGNVLWGLKGRVTCAIIIVTYLGGVLISRVIMIATIMR